MTFPHVPVARGRRLASSRYRASGLVPSSLALTPGQVEAITVIHERMREAAIAEGERFVEAERLLADAFRGHSVTEASSARRASPSGSSSRGLRAECVQSMNRTT